MCNRGFSEKGMKRYESWRADRAIAWEWIKTSFLARLIYMRVLFLMVFSIAEIFIIARYDFPLWGTSHLTTDSGRELYVVDCLRRRTY